MKASPRYASAVLQVAVSATCFGAMAIFAHLAYAEGVDPVALLFLRFGLAGIVLALVMTYRRQSWPRGRSLAMLIGMGGVGYVSQSLSFFSALQYAPAALVALLLYLHPVLIALASGVLFGERLSATRLCSIVLALAGIALVLDFETGGHWQGYVLGCLAAALYAAYLMTGQRVLRVSEPLPAATVVILSAAVVFGLLALVLAPQWPRTATSWFAAVAIALVSTVLAMLLLFSGIKVLGATNAATISMLEPVTTALLGAVFIDEALGLAQWLGMILVLCALVWLIRDGSDDRERAGSSQ